MKQAKASIKEAEALLKWCQNQPAGRIPPYARTIHGYLLLLEHCADPEKEYLDFKPGTSPQEIAASRERIESLHADNARLRGALANIKRVFQPSQSLREVGAVYIASEALKEGGGT